MTLIASACAVLVFYDTFYQAGTLQRFVSKLASILAPVLYGFAIAYLLTPIMSWLENAIRALWKRCFKKDLRHPSGAALTETLGEGVDYLITNTPDSGTAKNKKAVELGVAHITEAQFNDMIGRKVQE